MTIISKKDFPFLAYSAVTLSSRAVPLSIRLRWCKTTAKIVGSLWYRIDRLRSTTARQNIQSVLGKHLSPTQVESIAKTHFQSIAFHKIFNDLLPELNIDEFRQFLDIEGEEHLRRALAQKRGVILLGAHYGLHGYIPLGLLKLLGYQFSAVIGAEVTSEDSWAYRHIVNPIRSRNWDRFHVIDPNGSPQREMVECLQQNHILAIWGEFLHTDFIHLPPPQVVRVPLLGHTVALKTGPFRMARWLNSPVLPNFILPRPGGRFALKIEAPMQLSDDQSTQGLVADLSAFINLLEPHILRNPALWMFWRHEALLDLMEPA
jgi:KDO2-lipid IV(A) lauroyltransferase